MVLKVFRSVLIIVLLGINGLLSEGFAQQLTVNCYPQNLDAWTGSCTNSLKTDYSYVYGISSNSKRGWMKFDITAIPDNAIINSVKIYYYAYGSGQPYYRFTKLNLDPVTSGASTIYSTIAQANSAGSVNTYYEYTGSNQNSFVNLALNGYATTNLQSSLVNNYFCVGVYEYETYGSYTIRINGWNQTNKPYLEVTYTPNFSNDIGIQSFVSPESPACEGNYPIQVNLQNFGVNTITSAMINWSINGATQTSVPFTGSLAPGATQLITLNPSYTFNPGNVVLYAQTSGPNGAGDPNVVNDNKTHIVQVIAKPVIYTNPTNQTTSIGGNAIFGILGGGAGVTYQWQMSIDNGATYSNISNVNPYSGAGTNTLSITAATLGMTGYLYRCHVSGTCSPDLFSDSAMLIVGSPIESVAEIAYACAGNPASVPVVVQNMLSITNFKLTLSYNNTNLTFNSISNVSPALSGGTWNASESGGIITLEWTSSTPLTLSSETICKINFTYNSGDNPVTFTSSIPNTCYFLTPLGIQFPTNYTTGAVNNANGNITANPFNILVGMNANATFTVTSTGAPTYQWQVSTNNGLSWSNITNTSPYSGATSYQLTITNCPLSMNNYQYRCVVSGCTNSETSTAATLGVVKIVKTNIAHYTKCVNDVFIVPVRVWNFDAINAVSLGLQYDKSVLRFMGFQNLYPSVLSMMVNADTSQPVPIPSVVYFGFFTLTTASIPDGGIMVELLFKYLGGSTDLTWDLTISNYGDISAAELPTIFENGSVGYAGPVITTNPTAAVSIYATEGTTLSIAATGVGTLSYQWQYSSNGGTTWANVPSSSPYSNYNTPNLTITGATVSLNGYKYRCVVSGLCTPANTTATTLTVFPPPIYCKFGNIISCYQDTVMIPINVVNCNSIGSFNLVMNYNSSQMTYAGYKQLSTTLSSQTNFNVNTSVTDLLTITWNSTAASNVSGVLVILKFIAPSQFCNSDIIWKTIPTNTSWFKNVGGTILSSLFTDGDVCISSLPISYNIMTQPLVANGHFCQGGSGVQICLENSQTDVQYTLYMNGSIYLPVVSLTGTGGVLCLDTVNTPGVYSILSYSPLTGCTKFMDGDITVIADAPPSLFNVTGGGSYCTGSSGLPIGLSGSQTGITYYLIHSGTIVDTLPGTGSALNFGVFTTTGNYTIKAINDFTETCPTFMTGTATITENPVPAAAGPITGLVSVCQGATSVNYTIDPIAFSTSYPWNYPAGFTVVSGNNTTNIAFNIGSSMTPGLYTISVSGYNTNCSTGPSSTINVQVNALPTVTLANPGEICLEATPFLLTGGSPAGGSYLGPAVSANYFNPILTGSGTTNVTYTYTNGSNCTNTATIPVIIVSKPKIYGYVAYANPPQNTKMGNILLKLKLGATEIGTYLSDNGTGNYDFRCLASATYTMEVSTTRPWTSAEANAGDALFTAQYAVNQAPGSLMNALQKKAADVNNSGYVNATDALLIMRRWVGLISSFNAGNWVFEYNNSVTVGTANNNQIVKCLKVGDPNASFVPPPSNIPPIGIEKQGIIAPDFQKIISMPVNTKNDLDVAALSLAFEYPYEKMDIIDIETSLDGLVWNVIAGQIRIAWYSLNQQTFKAGERLFNIIIRIDDEVKDYSSINFTLVSESRMYDKTVSTLEDVVLKLPELKLTSGATEPGNEVFLGTNVPNPFNQITNIEYSIPGEAFVKISIYNLLGQETGILVNQKKAGGIYNITFDASNYSPGVYLYKLQVNSPDGEFVRTKTMVIKE